VVTGAAGGIGHAVARALVAAGIRVHGLDRDGAGLAGLAAALPAGALTPYTVDLADRAATDRILAQLLAALGGRCDILVNNAGVSRLRSLGDTDDALLDWLFEVNFKAAFRVTRALLPVLGATPRAAIVNLGSELALVGAPDYSAYCATKGAIVSWTRALAVELAPRGIRVNAVCPGPIDTALLQQEFGTSGDPDAARAAEISLLPLGRLGQAADIGAVVAFLASDAAGFVTGAAWPVDGGKTAR
jgi:NAD(P)-dependent dehydrogenase (short-subunit alcohol dehydrogenase family)